MTTKVLIHFIKNSFENFIWTELASYCEQRCENQSPVTVVIILTSCHLLNCQGLMFRSHLTLWSWSWMFTVQHTMYVQCEYLMNQEGQR